MCSKILKSSVLLLQISSLLADVVVQLPTGQIRGREDTTIENKSFYAFQGVPYAAPPIGELRFKVPQPVVDWDDTLDATKFSSTCFQTSTNDDNESEDCLYINIYTPELPSEDNNVSLPVMFFIHGGGFVDGTAADFAPDLFVNNDVILATINYRVGIFGFISTQDDVIPGNNGLKDQRFAIQWTHDNIHLFGGNPDKITIFGHIAGSASCSYQLLNQESNGLFQGAILESGTFLSPWAYQRRARQIAFKTASFLNSTFENSDDSQALFDYLLTVEARDLDAAAEQYHNYKDGPEDLEISQGFYWAPIVEVKNRDAFLTKKMYGLLEAGNVIRVPILIGITSEENIGFNQDEEVLRAKMAAYDENLSWIVPNDMVIFDETKRIEMGGLIRDLYTGGEPLADHLGDGVRYSSDNSFTRSVIKHAELFSKVSETYFYQLSYDGEMPGGTTYYEGAETVGHGEDIAYLFCSGEECRGTGYPESDTTTRQRLIKLWTDFAKYRNPTPEPSELLQNITWPLLSIDDGNFYYLDINETLEIKNHPKETTYNNWNDLYARLGYNDFDTY
ncbi:carboxylic ester hydrolase-like isoform X1 [Zophobas morio]|uniref:carboxylic ester hydrolase-like isoform X1 n=1 Tax=Zophobas morio TaxID=2755281 RepID=UPI00308358D7